MGNHFYKGFSILVLVQIVGRNLMPLTYLSKDDLRVYDIVEVDLGRSRAIGVVSGILDCEVVYKSASANRADYEKIACVKIENLPNLLSAKAIFFGSALDYEALAPSDLNYADMLLIRFSAPLDAILESIKIDCSKISNLPNVSRVCGVKGAKAQDGGARDLKSYRHYEILSADRSARYLTSLQKNLLAFLCKYYMCNLGIGLNIFTLARKDMDLDAKLARKELKISSNLNALSKEQDQILLECAKRDVSLIFGATGSGKTEIYFHAIKECVESGKQALFLMPEISLTPQTKNRLDIAFPNAADVWHSGRTKAQKQKILEKLQAGDLRIIAGARSALFLPYQNLGLIIIDEEHDSSYKSVSQPKYNARDLAIYMKSFGVKVIMGSATPSVKSYYLAKNGAYLSLLNNRFFNSNQEIIYDSTHTMDISPLILEHVIKTLESKRQVIIFAPLRANFKILLCLNCKEKIVCPNCSVTLSVHNKNNAMMCHYCNFTQQIPDSCPNCGENLLSGFSIGTEEARSRLRSALLERNISANIGIFDRDYITTQNKLEKTLSQLNSGDIDILIGTQMISKGHDYHNVGLSVVLGIDFMLHSQSYRAMEEAFSMMYQVAGRSGRKEDGKIILQTRYSSMISRFWGDYRKVIDFELSQRAPNYPPFARLALVSFVDNKDELAYEKARAFVGILKDYLSCHDFEIVGICKAPVFKIKKKYCYQALLRSSSPLTLQKALARAIRDCGLSWDIDIDPLI